MEKNDFLKLADTCLEHIAAWLEPFDPDEVDFVTADGVLTIEFPGGDRYVLNRQTAADQMWFAAGVRAGHYDWDASSSTWVSDKDGHELYGRISEAVSEKLGRTVQVDS